MMTSVFHLTLHGFLSPALAHIEVDAILELQICFHHKRRLLRRTPTGLVVRIRDDPLGPQALSIISFSHNQLSNPQSFEFHIRHSLSRLITDPTVCDSLAPQISTYAVNFAIGSAGFFHRTSVFAVIECVEKYWVDQQPAVIQRNMIRREREGHGTYLMVDESVIFEPMMMMGMDGQDLTISNIGASASAIEKLREEGKFMIDKDDNLGACSVCLEELFGVKELIKMPCTHLYHTSCIITWLEKSNSCPLCRYQLEV